MPVFNLADQNTNLDNKIVAGLERLSQVFRILLWEKAKAYGLSPIQIQLLIFIRHHAANKTTVSYLAREFNVTKPTISDAIKVLEQKKLISKLTDRTDTRSYAIQLTTAGKKIVAGTEDFADPLVGMMAQVPEKDKAILWDNLSDLIWQLNRSGIISVQRTCYSCRHYMVKDKTHFCNLLNLRLESREIRIDCPEYEQV